MLFIKLLESISSLLHCSTLDNVLFQKNIHFEYIDNNFTLLPN